MFTKTKLIVNEKNLLTQAGLRTFTDFMSWERGEKITRKRGRKVIRFSTRGRTFYLKKVTFSFREFIKNSLQLKFTPCNAVREWKNINALKVIGIGTANPIAFGEKRILGFEVCSFLMTEHIYGASSVEELAKNHNNMDDGIFRINKKKLITDLAIIARKLHKNGMFHQDFYLGHIFVGNCDKIYLIDLQRLRCKEKVPKRYIIKDLAQLNFSAGTIRGISNADRMRFFHCYLNVSQLDKEQKKLARQIIKKTIRISKHTTKLLERRKKRGEIQ